MVNNNDERKENIAYGVQQSIPSIRLYEYEKVCGASNIEIPEVFRLNDVEMGIGVKNQGMVGACVACATSTAIESLRLRELLEVADGEPITDELFNKEKNNLFGYDEISEGYTYGSCRQDTSRSSGMIVTDALKYLSEKGTVPKKLFNFLDEMPDIKNIVKKYPELVDEALKYRIKGYVTMSGTKSVAEKNAKEALMRYRTPLVAVSPSTFGESHCICIVGWDDTKDAWLIKNSWGELNGDKGLGHVKKSSIAVNQIYLLLNNDIEMPFEDVKEDDWFYKAVKHVYFSDIMNGRSDSTFAPNEPITRAEMATVISRLMKKIDERFDNFNKILEEKDVFERR